MKSKIIFSLSFIGSILLGLFIVFSLNRCTVACNRDSKINKQNVEILQKDSIIKTQIDSLKYLTIRFDDAQNSKSDLKDVALGSKQELELQVNQLIKDKEDLNNKINSLTSENNKLKKENQQLKQQINKNE